MTNLGFSPSRWLGLWGVAIALGAAGGCASTTSIGNGGGGGTTTSASSTTSQDTGGAGGSGGTGTTSTSSTTTTSSTSSTSSTSTTSSTSSTTSGTGGDGGSGGGSTWTQPPGTADFPAEVEQNNLKVTANLLAAGTKGFTAAIYPQGDVDVFEFDVTTAGTSATITTSDGMGGCPTGAKTYVRVFDSNNAVLATNSGTLGCVNLTPAANNSLAGLPIGKYYVKIESANINAIPFYVLEIKLAPPGCADGIPQVSNAEQCDDGNTVSGDGCSATCKLESGTFLDEVEPNDAQDTGNLLDGYAGAVGQINTVGDGDWYTFNVTVAGSSVFAEVGNGFTGCPTNLDSKIYLYNPSKVKIAEDDDGGVSPCSKITPVKYPTATNLPVGLYAIKVERLGNTAAAPFYVLKLKVSPPGCGDALVQGGEQCDDGNTVAGDGCSSTCQFEKNYIPETEVNDTQALANVLPAGGDGFIGSINPAGDDDYFAFDVTIPGSSVTIHTGDGLGACPSGFDSKIYLYDPAMTQIASNDDGAVPPCSTISPSTAAAAGNLSVGTYRVRVERYGDNATQGQYVVSIKVSGPGCGDGILQTGEQCDDNNNAPNDGCSPTCLAEPPYEIEPNNSTAQANPLWPNTTQWKGAISPIGDHDYYKFTLTTVASITAVTHNANDPANCSFDTVIHIVDSNGVHLAQDDDAGPGSCSKLDPIGYPAVHNLLPGTYYLWVQRYNDTQTIPLYQLDLTIQ